MQPFEDFRPANLNDRICAIRVVRVAGQKTVLDALYNDEVEVGCSGAVFKVLLELSDKLVVPSCTGLAEVQVGSGLGLGALRADN
jgi:hypothetical protein